MNQLYKAIIVDDEPAARRLMKSMLQEHSPLITVLGEATNGKEAVRMIEALKPDLVFLDIQMPDLTGFEVLEKLQHRPNVIFVTAYDQYAVKAFENFSVDYLLKPVKEERLQQALHKLQLFGKINPAVDMQKLQEIIQQWQVPAKVTALTIRTGDRITLLRFEQIAYLEAQDKYVYIFTFDGQKYLSDQSLSAISEKLPASFHRIQKSYIINKDRIKEMHRHFNGRFLFIMDDKNATRLTSGRTYYDEIKQVFGI